MSTPPSPNATGHPFPPWSFFERPAGELKGRFSPVISRPPPQPPGPSPVSLASKFQGVMQPSPSTAGAATTFDDDRARVEAMVHKELRGLSVLAYPVQAWQRLLTSAPAGLVCAGDRTRMAFIFAEQLGGSGMDATLRTTLVNASLRFAAGRADGMRHARWFLIGLAQATPDAPGASNEGFALSVARHILKPSFPPRELAAYQTSGMDVQLVSAWLDLVHRTLVPRDAMQLCDLIHAHDTRAPHPTRPHAVREALRDGLLKGDNGATRLLRRYVGLNEPMKTGTQMAEAFRQQAEVLGASQDELARFLLHNLGTREGKAWTLQASRLEALLQPAWHWKDFDTLFLLVEALARSLALAADAQGKAAHALRKRILSLPEPDRTFLVCAYANGMRGDREAVSQAFTQTAKQARSDAAALHAIDAGLALQADPLSIYRTLIAGAADFERLRFSHLFTMTTRGMPGLPLAQLGARGMPPFDKAVLAAETVCQREPAMAMGEVRSLRKGLVHDAAALEKTWVSPGQARIAARVADARSGTTHPNPHPHALVGGMLGHAYARLTRQNIASARAAWQAVPCDTKADHQLRQLADFLREEYQALVSRDVPARMCERALKSLEAQITLLQTSSQNLPPAASGWDRLQGMLKNGL